jgi:hypothetical protein
MSKGCVQRTLAEQWERYSETWPYAGTMLNGIAFRRSPLGRGTDETESSSWRTPDANTGERGWKSKEQYLECSRTGKHAITLNDQVRHGLLPTPRAREGNAGRKGSASSIHNARRRYLDGVVQEMYPTPRAIYGPHPGMKDTKHLTGMAQRMDEASGQLNPAWVEWLQGFPPGWTDLSASETRSSRKSQK